MSTATLLSPIDLLDAHTFQRQRIHEQVEAQALAAFNLPSGLNAEDEVEKFLSQMFPVVTAGQQLTVSTTTNYVAQTVSALTGTPPVVTKTAALSYEFLRGTGLLTVYRRPIIVALSALAAGATTAVAVKLSRDRLTRLVDDDLSLAHRQAALTAINSDDRISGYRRVIRPEGQDICGLCVAASDQRYGREDLMPLHTRCRCGVMPIVRTSFGRVKDPGRAINGQSVTDLYTSAVETVGSTDSGELAKARFSVHQHGELGPVLRAAGDHFTGPSEIAAA